MSKLVDVARRRWKVILVMTVLFLLGLGLGASGSEPAEAGDVANAAAPAAKTVTVDGEPVTVTETETVKKRVVKWRTKIKRITRTVTETVQASGGGRGSTASCHPSYKGACLDPNASDYDCEGGSGDGPKYTGYVRVVGYDQYDLDGNNDGEGCE
jgi:hypothetical protein